MNLKLAAKQYRHKGSAQLISAAGKAIEGLRPSWEKMMTAISAALIEDFGNEIAEDLGAEKAADLLILRDSNDPMPELKWQFDPMSAAVRAWIIKHGAEDVKSILATNLDDVKRVILAGVDEDLSTVQIAKNLRKFYTDRSPFKAMRVARTEVCKASSFGNIEAARQSKVVEKKTWLTSRDDRVRDEHVAMDGESVGLNDNFSNGLEYPSEPMCRCVLTFQSGR